MNGPTPKRLVRFARGPLGLRAYLSSPGDGRERPRIGARGLLWAYLLGIILRESAFHAIERLVRSARRYTLGVAFRFGDDALAYFAERLDPHVTRPAVAIVVRRAKRRKAFENTEIWDADDFDPRESLCWDTVRVLRYRQHKPSGDVVEAYWLTDFPTRKVGSQSLFTLCNNRWEWDGSSSSSRSQ